MTDKTARKASSTSTSAFAVAIALGLAAAMPAQAALSSYSQNFEALVQADPDALGNDGWIVGANVFAPDGTIFLYNYFAFPAPNGTGAFSNIAAGEGGPSQGDQQLVVFNDYNNADHNIGNRIEAFVMQEQTIGAGDVGSTWSFSFDAKLGDIAGASTAAAFIKILDPNAGYFTTGLVMVDMTSIDELWNRYLISLTIDTSQVGQLLQFGFTNVASNFESSGIVYDNIEFSAVPLPAALWMFASAFAGLAALRRKS